MPEPEHTMSALSCLRSRFSSTSSVSRTSSSGAPLHRGHGGPCGRACSPASSVRAAPHPKRPLVVHAVRRVGRSASRPDRECPGASACSLGRRSCWLHFLDFAQHGGGCVVHDSVIRRPALEASSWPPRGGAGGCRRLTYRRRASSFAACSTNAADSCGQHSYSPGFPAPPTTALYGLSAHGSTPGPASGTSRSAWRARATTFS
jgi:hypothetical protein